MIFPLPLLPILVSFGHSLKIKSEMHSSSIRTSNNHVESGDHSSQMVKIKSLQVLKIYFIF